MYEPYCANYIHAVALMLQVEASLSVSDHSLMSCEAGLWQCHILTNVETRLVRGYVGCCLCFILPGFADIIFLRLSQ